MGKRRILEVLIILSLTIIVICNSSFSPAYGAEEGYLSVARNFLNFVHCDKGIVAVSLLEGNVLDANLPPIPIAHLMELEKGGYILVAASKNLTPIKAYSLNNRFETLPPLYKQFLLRELEYNIRALSLDLRALKPPSAVEDNHERWEFLLAYDRAKVLSRYTPGTFLLQTEWNQKYPYNISLPEISGESVVAGCVNVAMAQIMRYYAYPLAGSGVVTTSWNGQELKAILGREYHLENMPYVLNAVTPRYQKEEVAGLIRDIAIANTTNFGTSASPSSLDREAMAKHFGFSTGMASMENSDLDAFFAKIRAEIDANRPVLITFPGHMAIADGYSSHPAGREIHINFGWGGTDDGFYFLDQTVITTNHEYPPDILKIHYNVVPCSGSDCYTNLEAQDFLAGHTAYGRFNYAVDSDEYEVYLKGPTNIIGTRGYTVQGFYISVFNSVHTLIASDDAALSLNLSPGRYRVKASLCYENTCYTYGETKLNYTITIVTSSLTDKEKAEIDNNSDIPPQITSELKDIIIDMHGGPHRILIDAGDENGDAVTLKASSTNEHLPAVFEKKNILTITPAAGITQAARIRVRVEANGRHADKTFILLAIEDSVSFGARYEVTGKFLGQDTFNRHKVVMEGASTLTCNNAKKNQTFFASVMDMQESYIVAPVADDIAGSFTKGLYFIGASLWEHPEAVPPYGIQFLYEEGDGDTYVVKVCCPDADDDIFSVAGLLGIDISALIPAEGISISPQSCDFGEVTVGSQSVRTFTITTTGGSTLDIGAIVMTGTDASEFSITNDACSGKGIGPFGQCCVDVAFVPDSTGAKNASLVVPSSDPNTPEVHIPLTGTGAPLPVHTIKSQTGNGGRIEPSGTMTVVHGNDKTFTITANPNFHVACIVADGVPIGALTSYTFFDVTQDHSIEAKFSYDTTRDVGAGYTYPAIQGAIDIAVSGDVIEVHSGTYTENINFNGKAITVRSSEGPPFATIDGGGKGPVVTFLNGEGMDSVLSGFIIRNGNAEKGGGVFCRDSSPMIIDCFIIDNTASSNGGGIYCSPGAAVLINCMFWGNSANGVPNHVCLYNASNTYNDLQLMEFVRDVNMHMQVYEAAVDRWLARYRLFGRLCGATIPNQGDYTLFISLLP